MRSRPANSVFPLAMTAVMAAVLCVLGPLAIPAGPVPVSLVNLGIFLSLYLLSWKRGTLSVLVYILLGGAGMPVFSGFTGGLGKLLGPTGGYILGYLALALISGWAIHISRSPLLHLAGMALGTAVLYAMGTAWFCFQTGNTPEAALGLCVFPFLPGDLVKMGAALAAGPLLRRRLAQAGLHPEL